MTAKQISLIQMYGNGRRDPLRELLDDMNALSARLDRMIADPSWLVREPDDAVVYSSDEDDWRGAA